MKLRKEKTLRRKDGSRVMIITTLRTEGYGARRTGEYHQEVLTCGHKKRTWVSSFHGDDYQYRALGTGGRQQFERDSLLGFVTESELQQAATELWEGLKP